MKFLTASTAALAMALSLGACAPAPEEAPAAESVTPAAPAIAPIPASADVKPFAIGELQAAAVRDGALQTPNDNKTLAINKTKADVDAVLAAAGLSTDMLDLSIQPLVVKSTDRVMLFDAGAGGAFGPNAGKLPASLAAASVDPATVTDVFISHGHGDHVGGLVSAEGALVFPNATVRMAANEWTALQANAQMAALVGVITPKIATFQPGEELVAGVVKANDIQGHTPGHSGYTITSGSDSLLYIGDTMHHSVISVQQPDWTIAFDGDAPTAQASRKQVLETAAASGQRVYAVHFPFPGLGKFEKQGETFVWVPEAN